MKLPQVFLLAASIRTLAFSAAPWPYLQIYPPVNATDTRTPLFFTLMLSSTGYRSILAVPGVQVALDYINSEPSILPGYTLHYTLSDSLCDEKVTTDRMFEQLQQSPVKLGWLGSGCSVATAVSALWTQLYNLTQVSCLSSSPTLTDRETYRYYFQMQPSASVLGKGLIGIISEYGWKRVGLIMWLDPVFSLVAESVKQDLETIEIYYSETFLADDGLVFRAGAKEEGDPFDPEMRVFVLVVAPNHARWLACQAFQRGMSYPTHQFLILGASDGSWLIEPDPTADLGCSLEDRIQTLQFALTVSIPDTRTRETAAAPVGGLIESELREKFNGKANSPENQDLNLVESVAGYSHSFSVTSYDATFVLALALNNTYEDLLKNQTFSQEAARQAGLEEGENFTLANFSYSNSVILQRMFDHISSTDFLGITGRVEFDKNGIRDLDQVTIMQFIPVTGTVYGATIGSVALCLDENMTHHVEILSNITKSLYWTKGIPTDGTRLKQIVTVSVPVTVIFTFAGLAGIAFAAAFGSFNFIFRKKRIIRLSSPKLNYLIVWGAIHFYLSAIGLVIPTTDPDTVVALCFVNLTVIYTGYSLCYGTILVKMFRVWYIFNNHTMKKKFNITDFHLGCAVMSLVGIDLFMILTFVAVQGLCDKLDVNLVPNPENPITLLGPTQVVQENYVYACDSDGRNVLVIMLYISKILLQICSLALAFWTRNVKVKGLDDSKYIPSAIYVSTIVLPISLTAAFALRSHVNVFPAVLSIAHLFGATIILIIVFVPRMIGLYKDPTGINVFDNRYSSPNYDENDIVALRRDVQQLRVTLHFAQKKCKCSGGTSDDSNGINEVNKTSHNMSASITTTSSQDHN